MSATSAAFLTTMSLSRTAIFVSVVKHGYVQTILDAGIAAHAQWSKCGETNLVPCIHHPLPSSLLGHVKSAAKTNATTKVFLRNKP